MRNFVWLILVLVEICTGWVVDLHHEIPANHYLDVISIAMFTKDDTPFGSNEATVRFDLEFKQKIADTVDTVDVVLFHYKSEKYLGQYIGTTYYLCCYQNEYLAGECDNPGKAIIRTEDAEKGTIFVFEAKFSNLSNVDIAVLDHTKDKATVLEKSGIWQLWILNCAIEANVDHTDPSTGHVRVDGTVSFMNPYGHLPGNLVGLLPVYWALSLGYAIAAATVLFLIIKYKKDIMKLQLFICVVLALGFTQNLLFALDFQVYNVTGSISVAFNVLISFATAMMRAASLNCILLVALGYTVITPDLPHKQKRAVFIAFVTYLLLQGSYQFISMLRYTPQTEEDAPPAGIEIILLLLVTVMDFGYIFCTFFYLFRSIKILKVKKQTEKALMFKRLAGILCASYAVSLLMFLIQLGASWDGQTDNWWKGWWVFDAYWNCLYFVVGVMIAYIWRPNQNNKRYAYAAQLDTEAIDLPDVNAQEDNNEQDNNEQEGGQELEETVQDDDLEKHEEL